MLDAGSHPSTILTIRHGQSTWNKQRRWQGQADPPLSDFGQKQAAVAADQIGQVDVVVSSPLQRAHQTAEIICEILGLGPIHVIPDLQERSIGSWSGLTAAEIENGWPGWLDDGRRPQGWEDDLATQTRALKAMNQINENWPGASVLAVCHGGIIIALEESLGVNKARIPNLAGRVFKVTSEDISAGDSLELLPQSMQTGATKEAEPKS